MYLSLDYYYFFLQNLSLDYVRLLYFFVITFDLKHKVVETLVLGQKKQCFSPKALRPPSKTITTINKYIEKLI